MILIYTTQTTFIIYKSLFIEKFSTINQYTTNSILTKIKFEKSSLFKLKFENANSNTYLKCPVEEIRQFFDILLNVAWAHRNHNKNLCFLVLIVCFWD